MRSQSAGRIRAIISNTVRAPGFDHRDPPPRDRAVRPPRRTDCRGSRSPGWFLRRRGAHERAQASVAFRVVALHWSAAHLVHLFGLAEYEHRRFDRAAERGLRARGRRGCAVFDRLADAASLRRRRASVRLRCDAQSSKDFIWPSFREKSRSRHGGCRARGRRP